MDILTLALAGAAAKPTEAQDAVPLGFDEALSEAQTVGEPIPPGGPPGPEPPPGIAPAGEEVTSIEPNALSKELDFHPQIDITIDIAASTETEGLPTLARDSKRDDTKVEPAPEAIERIASQFNLSFFGTPVLVQEVPLPSIPSAEIGIDATAAKEGETKPTLGLPTDSVKSESVADPTPTNADPRIMNPYGSKPQEKPQFTDQKDQNGERPKKENHGFEGERPKERTKFDPTLDRPPIANGSRPRVNGERPKTEGDILIPDGLKIQGFEVHEHLSQELQAEPAVDSMATNQKSNVDLLNRMVHPQAVDSIVDSEAELDKESLANKVAVVDPTTTTSKSTSRESESVKATDSVTNVIAANQDSSFDADSDNSQTGQKFVRCGTADPGTGSRPVSMDSNPFVIDPTGERPKDQGDILVGGVEVPTAAPASRELTFGQKPEKLSAGEVDTVVKQVSERMQMLAASRPKGGVTIHLNPDSLGQITIVVKTAGQAVETLMTASDERVREALDRNHSRLIEAMDRSGYQLQAVTVSSQSGNATQHDSSRQWTQSNPQSQSQDSSRQSSSHDGQRQHHHQFGSRPETARTSHWAKEGFDYSI